jgi:enoyl-CoA hydratase/carnithine racemase
MRLFLTGERFMATRALEYGLLHRVVAAEELASVVQEEVDAIGLGGPIAIAEAKKLIRTVARLPMDEAFAYAEQKINELFRSEEAAEGMAAFVAKRGPEWTKSTD